MASRTSAALGCEAYGVQAIDRAGSKTRTTSPRSKPPTWSTCQVAVPATWSRRCVTVPSGRPSSSAGERRHAGREQRRRDGDGRVDAGPPAGQFGGCRPFWEPGLGLLPGIGVIPHYDRFGPERTRPRVEDAPDGMVVLGIDEDTVILLADGEARVRSGSARRRSGRTATDPLRARREPIPPELVRWP